MTLDRTTETIAHFIGMFHLDLEEMRLRMDYEAFKFARDTGETAPIEPPDIEIKSPFALKGFDPDVPYEKTAAVPGPVAPANPQIYLPPYRVSDGTLTIPDAQAALLPVLSETPAPSAFFILAPQPNSIVIAIEQSAVMYDDDLLLFGRTAEFVDPAVLLQKLDALLEIAGAASIFGLSGVPLSTVPTSTEAEALAMAVGSVEAPETGSAEVTLRTGEEAEGIVINGEIADEMPVFEDLLPAFLASDENEDAEDRSGTASGNAEAEDDADSASSEPQAARDPQDEDAEGGAGASGNAEAEEDDESASSEPQDARDPQDEDAEDAATDPEKVPGATPGRDEAAFAMPPDGTTSAGSLPFDVDPGHNVVTGANLAVNETVITSKWMDAPVIAVAEEVVDLDIVSQVNVRAEGGRLPESALVSPSKSLNAVSITTDSSIDPDTPQTKGSGSPAISDITHVKGDLVAVNWVQQHVFASDFDRVEIEFSAAATYLSTGENTLMNVTSLIETGFHYDLILVGGSMISVNAIDQISVLLDSDMVSGSVAAGAELHARDNLQLNSATIEKTGKDTVTELKDSFKSALEAEATERKDLARDVVEDEMFEGIAALRALKVEKDLIKLNVLEQYNYLGDSDQLQLALDDFVMEAGAPVTFTTGSNAQLNSAKIKDIGLDSTVMAGGETYSDALIYQAELIDPDAAPTGVNLSALTSEAVAFLADGMIKGAAEHEQGRTEPAQDDFSTQDIFQTMLA